MLGGTCIRICITKLQYELAVVNQDQIIYFVSTCIAMSFIVPLYNRLIKNYDIVEDLRVI